ncbi:hypothetical protein JCM8547_001685 [Rhodosporidiobolus lusitaniae]
MPPLSPSPSSTLSSLTPSPEPASPSRKRPRLSTTSPPPAHFATVQSPVQQHKHSDSHPYSDLFDGLGADDFGLPPSSNSAVPQHDEDEEEELVLPPEGQEGGGLTVHEAVYAEGAGETAADDSGVGFLPDGEGDKPAEDGEVAGGVQDDELEFEGDDMWVDFEALDAGFDQPSALPSSMLSAATTGPSALDKGKRPTRVAAEDEEHHVEQQAGPRLGDFGFSDVNGGSVQPGGFVFATRKPFAVSEEAMQRARALLDADSHPSDEKPRETSMPPPPIRTSTPLPRAAPLHPESRSSPISRPSPLRNTAVPTDLLVPSPPFPSNPPAFTGFQTAAGSSFALPSAESLARAQQCLQGSSPTRPPSPTFPPASSSSHAPPPVPAFVGFQNAAGRALAMPSEESLRLACERFAGLSASPEEPRHARRPASVPHRAASRVEATSGRDVFEGSPAPVARVISGEGAGGSAKFALLPPLARLAAAGGVAVGDLEELSVAPDSPTVARSRSVGPIERTEKGTLSQRAGSSGRRTPLLPMDPNVEKDTEVELDEKVEVHGSSPSETMRASSSPVEPGSTGVSSAPILVPAFASPLPPLPPASTSSSTIPAPPAAPALVAPIPRRPALPSTSSSRASSALPGSRGLPFRSPLISGASTPSRGPSATFTPLRPSSLATSTTASTSTPGPPPHNPLLPPPTTQRRLNLGMTPRSKPFHLANTRSGTPASAAAIMASRAPPGGVGPRTGVKAFKTPFKGGKVPEGLTPVGLKGKTKEVTASQSATKTANGSGSARRTGAAKSGPDSKRDKAKLFDLDDKNAQRFNLLNFGMRPQTHYYEQLETLRLPPGILDMDLPSASCYAFPDGRTFHEAFSALQSLVVERVAAEKDLVTLPWVKNHWSLIVWKLASYVRSRPDLLGEWWTFERVMEQLRYRYEREINLAQRSCIKRIQEQDSPASLPMILCVSQIRWDEALDDSFAAAGDGEAPMTIVGLELTDGWYRIRSNVDQTLKSACERGKIVVGSKIAVIGAKLDSTRNEGTDVLQALSRSTLVISGNSTSLAPWHSTLGFRPEPVISSLDRLTSAGGVVPLVDVTVERAFPCGYVDLRKGRSTETWGEEEEQVRAEEWRRGRKRLEAKMAEQAEKVGTEEDELVELLQEAAERLEPSSRTDASTSSEEPDEILERLESAPNKQAVLRKLSNSQVRACLSLALDNAQASRFRAVEELQRELTDKYPTRDVRGFRVVRIRDAREGTKPSTRTALVTVWDAQSFEDGFFRQDGRYLISNLMPKGNWRADSQEISLTTRRDSRWQRL